jgi:hypothetical protein
MASTVPPRRGTPPPFPPRDLAQHPLPLSLRPGPWVRIVTAGHDPLHFGRSGHNRFDAPRGEFGVLYAADELAGAFIETFGRSPGYRIVSEARLRGRGLAQIEARRPLRLVDLRGPGLAQIGAMGEVTMGGSYRLSQRWALRLHPDQPDGLWYGCRHDPSTGAVAVFDRAQDALHDTILGLLADPPVVPLLTVVLDRYGFALDAG